MDELGYFEESTDNPETQKRLEADKQAVADELAYREWNLARWSIGLTALVGLGSIVAVVVAVGAHR